MGTALQTRSIPLQPRIGRIGLVGQNLHQVELVMHCVAEGVAVAAGSYEFDDSIQRFIMVGVIRPRIPQITRPLCHMN